jgi:hypothetical protein
MLAGANLAWFVGTGTLAPAVAQTVITVDATAGQPISPLLYGVNYLWDQVPENQFAAYRAAMDAVAHASLSRYLGGWGAESYEWGSNVETGRPASISKAPGEAPDGFLDAVPAASFITPSAMAIANPALIGQTARQSAALVASYGHRVAYWEIGNEWWLQAGAKRHPGRRAENLAAYAQLIAATAPAMKAVDPSIKIFATVDWTTPQDVATLRAKAGPAWADINGLSIHPYCGTEDPDRLCKRIPAAVAALRQESGKTLIYASEWSATRAMNVDDQGIGNANLTVATLGDLAMAGVDLAAYWPPVKVIPALAMISDDYTTAYPTGIAFGWMAQYYEGAALRTVGPVDDKVSIIVPSWGVLGTVQVYFQGFSPRSVISAEVLYENGAMTGIASLPVTIGETAGRAYVEFQLNPGTPGRGRGYEIARVTLG